MTSIGKPNKRRLAVHGLEMAYRDEGSGHPIVFLHGNPRPPTSGAT